MQKQEKETTRDVKNKLAERSVENHKFLADFGVIFDPFWVPKSMQNRIENSTEK